MSIQPSPALAAALATARKVAEERLQPLIAMEHLLYAILRGDEGIAVMKECGADAAEMTRELSEYLDLLETSRPRAAQLHPDLWRVLERSKLRVQAAGGSEISIGLALVSLFGVRDSYASMLLYAAGIDQLDLLRVCAHGTKHIAAEKPPGDWLIVRLHNDDFTTMEFVTHVLELVFRFNASKAQHHMLTIHKEGSSAIATLRRADAIERVNDLTEQATQAGFPLRCTLEPAE